LTALDAFRAGGLVKSEGRFIGIEITGSAAIPSWVMIEFKSDMGIATDVKFVNIAIERVVISSLTEHRVELAILLGLRQ
jgi:hypothetical protein